MAFRDLLRFSEVFTREIVLSRNFVAPYRVIPQHYLSDTALLRAMRFLVCQHGQLGAIPPSFSEHFPLGEHAKWRCDTPPQKGYLSDTCTIPHKNNNNKQNTRDTPLCDTISKRYCAIWGGGGISHWAAKSRKLQDCCKLLRSSQNLVATIRVIGE